MSTYLEKQLSDRTLSELNPDTAQKLTEHRYQRLLHSLDLAALAPQDAHLLREQQDVIFDCLQQTESKLEDLELELVLATSGFNKLPVLTDEKILENLPYYIQASTDMDRIRTTALEKIRQIPLFQRRIPYANALSTHSIGYHLGLRLEGETYFIPPCANDILEPHLQSYYRDFVQGAGLTAEESPTLLKYPFVPEYLVSPEDVEWIHETVPYFTYLQKAEKEGLMGFDKWSKAHLTSVLHEARLQGIKSIPELQYWLHQHPEQFHSEVFGDLNITSWQSRAIIQNAADMLLPVTE